MDNVETYILGNEHDLQRSFFSYVLDNDLGKSLEIIDLVKKSVFFKCQIAGGNIQIALSIHFVAAGYLFIYFFNRN